MSCQMVKLYVQELNRLPDEKIISSWDAWNVYKMRRIVYKLEHLKNIVAQSK